MNSNSYQPIVGLEIHVELKTASKMFCGCKNDPFHAPKPNIYTCPVCLGLPGALPVPNRKAVEWTIMLGLALNCQIQELSKFDRKNYFYPDLPKGYQISQYDQPIARQGELKLKIKNEKLNISEEKKIRIHRVHLEEDTGKLLHETVNGKKVTLIDFNRSGVPLVEIVTEPDIRSAEVARLFMRKLHQIIRYLGISDADMEKGSMRVEPNISVRKVGSEQLAVGSRNEELPKYKVEVKNINSFKFVSKAIDYEVERQIEILERGETPVQETRGWDEKKGITLPQRKKEEAHDYRYFPEPDIPPMRWQKPQITELKTRIPEMPDTKLSRFIKDYSLPDQDAERLTETKEMADYFEKSWQLALRQGSGQAVGSSQYKNVAPKTVANWIINKNIDTKKTSPEELLQTISSAKQVVQIDESELKKVIQSILNNNPKAVADYKSGKLGVIMFLVGQVMRELKDKGDANSIRNTIEKELQ